MNAGMRAGRAAWVLVLNSDVIVPPGALEELLARLGALVRRAADQQHLEALGVGARVGRI